MAEIAPFRGILYKPKENGDVSPFLAPPYDVISEQDRTALTQLDENNCVRLILPKDKKGGESDERYEVAAHTLQSFLARGVLARDEKPAIYRYHQVFSPPGEGYSQAEPITRKGFICRIRLHRFSERIVLPHERTLAGPKADRLKLKRATRTHLSQVFGLYEDKDRTTDQAFAQLEETPPALCGKTTDGVLHRLYKLTDPRAQRSVIEALADKVIYIADGHHRYETMLALREELRREPSYIGLPSSVEFGSIFLCNVADPGLLVFPTHRVVHGLPELDLDRLLQRATAYFQVDRLSSEQLPNAQEARVGLETRGQLAPTFLLLSSSGGAYLSLRPDADLSNIPGLSGLAVLRSLDVSLLHSLILEGLLGIDRNAQEAQTHLRYIKDTGKAIAEVRVLGTQLVLLMNPTKVSQVTAVSDAGEVMPQKSTYFYPKIASGLVLNPLDPAEPVGT